MQKKSLLLFFVLFVLLVPFSSAVVQAKPFLKSVTTEIFDGPFPPDDPEAGVYGRGVIHQTMILKGVNWVDEAVTLDVIVQMVWEIRLYEMVPSDGGFEAGDFLFLLKLTRIYEGTLVPDVPGGGFVTGTLVEDWVINVVADVPFPPDMDFRGHWVTLYRDGVAVKRIGFGVSPFQ